ncbi:hypothetical protein [Porphyrobacter sp. CACIAM 03H1]|uniref:DUF3108 domain-containing protein n=1 Tax=Porphyrobacter sp. CACIAM 03H1 TaxID=2003315 RepID=UPI0012FE3504|nr:hypothetical protein [Porphyrobacter sp. CACIAM 03H1]
MLLTFLAAATGTAVEQSDMQGARLEAGEICYSILAGGKPVGTTRQIITPREENGFPVWDIVVHQRAGGGAFDMRDHFVLVRDTMLPLRMESARGRERSERGWHRVNITYSDNRIKGTKETAAGVTPFDVPLSDPVWDGNLWGAAFAALPLAEGGRYEIPFWQYDKGFGSFTVRVVGTEDVETPDGTLSAWIVEAGDQPEALLRYQIARSPRKELGYRSARGAQQIDKGCD